MSRLTARNVRRRLEPVVGRLLGVEPVIALHGPRSVGKSTLLHEVARTRDATVLDLDDPGTREGSLPGTALLTGSTQQDALPRTAEALTGRVHHLMIWPLSQGEIGGVEEDFLPRLRSDAEARVAAWPRSDTTRLEYAERVCAGGFPLALRRAPGDRDRWFRDYVTQSVERDVRDLARIRDRALLREVLNRLAARTGSILDVSKAMAGLLGNRSTHESYIRLLEDLFLVRRLPAWGTTLTSRAAKSPKIHVVDAGLGSHLLLSGRHRSPAQTPHADAMNRTIRSRRSR